MLSRQRIVLSMLAEAGGSLNKLNLVKLLFLFNEENPSISKAAKLEFIPYHRGPYSFTLAHDLKNLENTGLLKQSQQKVTLTRLGEKTAAKTSAGLEELIRLTYNHHGHRTTDSLLDHVYSSFPWFTVNSQWEDRRAQSRPVAEIAVYTTSYEGVHIDGLLDRLMRFGIQRIIDVRSNPVARRFGFHKSTLARICPLLGVEYVHIPEVGIPGTWRTELGSVDSYQRLFQRYEGEVLRYQQNALDVLANLVLEKPSALMCKEADPHCCHRTRLAHEVSRQIALPVIDIGPEVSDGFF